MATGRVSLFAYVFLIAALAAGCLLGVALGRAYSAFRSSSMERQTEQQTRIALDQMKTIYVGDRLTDHVFEDLSGTPQQLRRLVQAPTWISVIQPGCSACEENVTYIVSHVKDSAALARFIFISAGNPRLLQDLQQETHLPSPILYDHRRA